MAKNPKIDQFPESEHCPGFWKINSISGCPYHCATCYLDASTGRFNNGKKINSVASIDKTIPVILKWLNEMGDAPAVLNTGETGDSFAFESGVRETTSLNFAMMSLFRGRKQKLLFLTKSSNTMMLNAPLIDECIFSFSVNPLEVSRAFHSPSVSLAVIRGLLAQGRRVRLRFDPIIPIPDWKFHYSNYIRDLISVSPEMFTLGSLRLTESNHTLRRKQGIELLKYAVREKDGGKHPWRIPYEQRAEMYPFIIGLLREHFPYARIGLCKETQGMREAIGVSKEDCNCLI